jgi:uncharacterized protein YpuA (DUF1002 family)
MQRPIVNIVDNQKEVTTNPDVSQSDIDYLLSKYGYSQKNTILDPVTTYTNPETFEEMISRQEMEKKRIEEDRYKRINGPKAVSFDSNNINYSETKWSDLDIDDVNKIGIKIQVVTDMKI